MTDQAPELLPLEDLPLYWKGRANALRLLDAQRTQSDAATLKAASCYEECANELKDALRALCCEGATGSFKSFMSEATIVSVNRLCAACRNRPEAAVAWLCEYDGHTDATTSRDTMCLWKDTLGRKITPLRAIQHEEPGRETMTSVPADEMLAAVRRVLARDKWPVCRTYDDAGLSERGYVEFCTEVFAALRSTVHPNHSPPHRGI